MRKTLLTLAMALGMSSIAQAVDWTLSSVTNVAQGGEVTVSSNGGNAAQIVDNNTGNGWQASAKAVGTDWALIKLNSTSSIGVVQVVWEASSATEYRVIALAEAPEYTSTEEGAEVQENTIADIESVAANAIKVVTFTAEAQNGNRFDEMEFAAEGVNYLLVYVDKESTNATDYGSYIREVRAAAPIENVNKITNARIESTYDLTLGGSLTITPKFVNGYGDEVANPEAYTLNHLTLSCNGNETGIPDDGISIVENADNTFILTPNTRGRYLLTLVYNIDGVVSQQQSTAYVEYDWSGDNNIALNKTAAASVSEASNANDGNLGSMCIFPADNDDAAVDGYWWVDLGDTYNLEVFQIVWEGAYGYTYTVEGATEMGAEEPVWSTIYTHDGAIILVDKNNNPIDSQTFTELVTARYLKISVTKPLNNVWGSKIREVRVMGKKAAVTDTEVVSIELSAPVANADGTYTVSVAGMNANGQIVSKGMNGVTFASPVASAVYNEAVGTYTLTMEAGVYGYTTISANIGTISDTASLLITLDWTTAESISTKTYNDKVVAIMSSHANTGDAANIVDGNEDTVAGFGDGNLQGDATNGPTADANWWVIDLGDNYMIDALNFVWAGGFANDYDVEFMTASQGADINSLDWSQADVTKTINITCDYNGNVVHADDYYVQGEAVTARYVRIVVNKAVEFAWGARIKEVYMMGEKKVITDTEIASMELTAPEANADGSYTLTVIAKNAEGEVLSAVSGIEFDSSVVASAVDNGDGSYNITLKEGLFGVLTITATAGDLTATTTLDVLPDWSGLGTTLYSYCTTTWNPSAMAYASENTTENYYASGANDGKVYTSWEISEGNLLPGTDDNWWYVDLGRDFEINAFKFYWEGAFPTKYEIQYLTESQVTNSADIDWSKAEIITHERTISGWDELIGEVIDPDKSNEEIVLAAAQEKIDAGLINAEGEPMDGRYFIDEYLTESKSARYIRILGKEFYGNYGMKLFEVLMTGPDQTAFTETVSFGLQPQVFPADETLTPTLVAYNSMGLPINKTLSIESVQVTDNSNVEGVDNATLQCVDGVFSTTDGKSVGAHYVTVTAKDGDETITVENVMIEAVVPDWSEVNNIAKQFELKDGTTTNTEWGVNKGNPLSTAYASHGGSSALNAIDATGTSKWEVSQADIAANSNVWYVIDLGDDYNVTGFELVWEGDSYATAYDVYMAPEDPENSDHPAWYDADPAVNAANMEAYKVYSASGVSLDAEDGYAYDNHAILLSSARYVMIKPKSTRDSNSSYQLAEVMVYSGDEERNTLKIATPQFDRSREGYRGYDDPEVATSVNASDPLIVSFEAFTNLGSEWYDYPENYEVKWNFTPVSGDFTEASIVERGKSVRWRDYTWKYPYILKPNGVGTGKLSVTITDKAKGESITSDELTIYSVTDNKNVARYAKASEVNVNVYTGVDEYGHYVSNRDASQTEWDRDNSNYDQPSSAIDGNYGSWYVVGYNYRSVNEAGVEGYGYKYDADTELENPYELVITYPDGYYLKELNLVEVQWEGAYAEDYDVYVQYANADDEAGIYPAIGDWTQIASYTDLHAPGVDQHETQQIYQKTSETTAAARAASFTAWENVKAVKVVMKKTGTVWGFKMWETSLYGEMNQTMVGIVAEQMVYADAAATTEATETSDRFYSFDIKVEVDEATYPVNMDAVEKYQIEPKVVAGYDANHLMFSNYSYTNGDGTKVSGAIEGEAASDVYEAIVVDALADHKMPEVYIEDVDPTASYMFVVTPLDAAGNALDTHLAAESNTVALTMPRVSYSASTMAIKPIAAEFEVQPTLNVAPQGSTEETPARYDQANQVMTTDGSFSRLNVVDKVLENWEVKYYVNLKLRDLSVKAAETTDFNYYYTSNGGKENRADAGIALNQDVPLVLNSDNVRAELCYLPVLTETKTVAIDGAPDDVNALTYEAIVDAPLSVTATVNVDYTRLNLAYERGSDQRPFFTTQMCRAGGDATTFELVYDNVAKVQAAPEVGENGFVAQKFTHEEESGYNDYYLGYTSINITTSDPETVHRYIGFHSSNGDSFVATGIGGTPSADGRGNNSPWYIEGYNLWNGTDDYVVANHNYSKNVALNGHIAICVDKLGKAVNGFVNGVVADEVADLYTVLFAEYPILLQEPIDYEGKKIVADPSIGGLAPYRPRPALKANMPVLGAVEAREAVAELELNGANTRGFAAVAPETTGIIGNVMQNVSAYTSVTQAVKGATTEMEDVVAETVGDFRIYPNPAVDVVNVAASMELGRVEIYSIDGALVKVVEADDTQAQIAVDDLSKGTYIVRAVGKTERLIKM